MNTTHAPPQTNLRSHSMRLQCARIMQARPSKCSPAQCAQAWYIKINMTTPASWLGHLGSLMLLLVEKRLLRSPNLLMQLLLQNWHPAAAPQHCWARSQ